MMKKSMIALMAGVALVPVAAQAQTASADRDAEAVERQDNIIVTAQRYEQRLVDVPVSISVIGAEEIRARSVTALADLQFSVPGLTIIENGVGRQSVQLRGVSNTIGSSTVGIYFDETPLALDSVADSFDVRLFDLERVEVLRGPQSTLYGQGSMGGTIRYIPAAPKLDERSGAFTAEAASTEGGAISHRAVAVANLPLSSGVAGLRLAAAHERIGGYIDGPGVTDINSVDIYTLRGSLLLQPTDHFSVSLLGMHQDSRQRSQNFGTNGRTAATLPTPIEDRYTLIQGKLAYDLGFAELAASGSYVDRRTFTQLDLSFYFVPLLVGVIGLPPGFISQVGIGATNDIELYNGELRLISQGEGPLSWQVGATYNDLRFRSFGATFTTPGALPFDLIASDDLRRSKSYAVYGQAEYALTPQLRATAGLRYFRDERTRDVAATNFGLPSVDTGRATFDTLNPRFNLSYMFTPDSMVFANASKGFRSGGFNQTSAGAGIVTVPPTYQPDEIWTYELGTKHQLFGSKLTFDASVYRSEWSNVQSNNFAPGSVVTIVNNSGHVSGWGVDLMLTARPTRDLTISGTFGWNDLKFDEASADKAPGDPVDAAVRDSWSVSVDYRPQLSNEVNGIFRADYQHAGLAQYTLRNQPAQVVLIPRRDLVNLRAGVAYGGAELSLFVNNLLNEDAPLLPGGVGLILDDTTQRPRVIGVTTNFRF